jgi:hypothetical protein
MSWKKRRRRRKLDAVPFSLVVQVEKYQEDLARVPPFSVVH